jgi:hypothetical protein
MSVISIVLRTELVIVCFDGEETASDHAVSVRDHILILYHCKIRAKSDPNPNASMSSRKSHAEKQEFWVADSIIKFGIDSRRRTDSCHFGGRDR